jgi:hypothetical protein
MKIVNLGTLDHATFPIYGPSGQFEIDAYFSDDGRLTELCIAGEADATVDEEVCRAAISAATALHKIANTADRAKEPAA